MSDEVLTEAGLAGCGIEVPAELLEDLCELAPDAFCPDSDRFIRDTLCCMRLHNLIPP